MKNIWHFDPNTLVLVAATTTFSSLCSPPLPTTLSFIPFSILLLAKQCRKRKGMLTKKMCIYAQKIDKSGGSLAEEIFILERRARP